MSFRTQYQRERVISITGEQMQPTYKLQYTEEGAQDLVKIGQVNLYEQIQSWRESCDIQVILKRYFAGDPTALNAKVPLFGDFTDMPTSTAGYLQLLNDAEESFSQLTLEQRAAFDHSPYKFFASIGTDEFNEKMGIIAPSVDFQSVDEKEVVSSES